MPTLIQSLVNLHPDIGINAGRAEPSLLQILNLYYGLNRQVLDPAERERIVGRYVTELERIINKEVS